MKNEANIPPSFSLVLRILCGGYLVYIAWELRSVLRDDLRFLIAAIVFTLVGLGLAGWSLWQLITSEYFRKQNSIESEESEDLSDE